MNIDVFDIYEYSLELCRPLIIRGKKMQRRNGFILHLKSDQQTEGFGEIAPLDGFNEETLSQARDQLLMLRQQIPGQIIPERIGRFNGQFKQWLGQFALKSSVQFGVESAILHLSANTLNVPLHQFMSKKKQPRVRVSGLLDGTKDGIALQAKDLVGQGFTELKLKVSEDMDQAIAKVKAVNDLVYGKAILHLDANQAWSFDMAVKFGKTIGCAAVSYIEEPFKDIEKIPVFFEETMIPVALDESLRQLTIDQIKSISGVEVIVLKPTVIGGIEKTLEMMTKAEGLGLDVVISSSFESSLGIWILANIAETSAHHTSAGLDTSKWFTNDVLRKKISLQKGCIDMTNQTIRAVDINFNVLNKL